MAEFGLIGNPVSHSKSPALFHAAYGEGKGSYELIEEQSCKEAMNRFLKGEYRGINVTAPFKEQVMEYVTDPDRVSSILGSANVLLKDRNYLENGKIYSYNTDYYGVKNSLKGLLSPEVGAVTVVGAGGAGKAAALAMADGGFKVFMANRSAERALLFAEKRGMKYVELRNLAEAVEQSQLLIYSISIAIEGLRELQLEDKIVFEANYAAPNLSPGCGVRSLRYIRGEYWLYNQAIPAFELFTGSRPDLAAMRRVAGI